MLCIFVAVDLVLLYSARIHIHITDRCLTMMQTNGRGQLLHEIPTMKLKFDIFVPSFLLFSTVILASKPFRLPGTVKPELYDISIIPIFPLNGTIPENYTEWTALGSVKIVFEAIVTNTNMIVLHANNISIDPSTVKVSLTCPSDMKQRFFCLFSIPGHSAE